jgi:hypothetical protein
MTSQPRRPVLVVLLVAAIAGALAACDGGTAPSSGAVVSLSPTESPVVSVESAPPVESASASAAPASSEPSPTASAAPSASASVAPTTTPRPSPTLGEPATILLSGLKLDAKEDPDGKNRRIEFRSQGTGTITVAVRAVSPQGRAVACLSVGGARIACKTTADGSITAKTTTRRADFVLTLRGAEIETPVVDVTITFPARTPSVTVKNARFDGTLYPDTNGLQAFVTPRRDGDVALTADWGGHPFPYEVDLMEQGGPGTHVLANQGPSTGVETALPVTAPNPWKLVLQNIAEGFGVTPLDATIAWP